MFILKFIVKLMLIPVWLVLLMIWLPVHLAVGICGMFHGLGKLFFGALTILAIALGMWENAIVFGSFIAGTFIIVLGGAVLEMLLEKVRHGIGSVITA